ncbi:hypothetical protein LWI29_011117 [Acer saccharum]|uniref:Cytochrome c domain-containing protein n=1 Tax=Acer saccharum TaxID=4024 RepID=A0AA39RYM7_ACESA|nr:hypothetical protein LWI29_011117 [Acer saccharum]
MASFSMAPPGNPAVGENIFRNKCAQCHTVDKVKGHKQANYSYSVDNRNLAVTWDEKTLYDFLLNPIKFLPGTEKDKIFPGVKTPQERADLIAYLKKSTASWRFVPHRSYADKLDHFGQAMHALCAMRTLLDICL